jgi:DNA invertase Pin-like site-specific DNA recombinase
LAHLKAKGEKYGPIPFGYKQVEKRLVEVEKEASIVAEILEQREQGSTLAAIADNLNTRGIKGKRGGRWYPSTVNYLIKRQVA